jgi:hypothetical protein
MPEDKSSKPVNKQPEQTTASPAAAPVAKPAGTKTSGLAIAALILAFIPGLTLIGLILGIVALVSIKKSGEKGKGLAIAAIILSVVFMLVSAGAVWAIYYSANKSLKDAGINVDTKSNTVTVNKDGESVSIGENAKLPDDFPSDVPIYEPSDVVASLKNGENSYSATLLSSDSISKVTEYYTAELPKNGWQTSDDTSSLTLENSTISTYKKDNRTLGVIVATDPSSNKTSITLSVTVEEPL